MRKRCTCRALRALLAVCLLGALVAAGAVPAPPAAADALTAPGYWLVASDGGSSPTATPGSSVRRALST